MDKGDVETMKMRGIRSFALGTKRTVGYSQESQEGNGVGCMG